VRPRKYSVRLLRVAEEDLNDLLIYIAADNRSAAEALADTITKNLMHLASHPFLGRVPQEDELMRLGYRFLVVANYLIFYTIENRTVLVHRIIHGARQYLKLL
jgi:toxin ParE1/3/4